MTDDRRRPLQRENKVTKQDGLLTCPVSAFRP